jgi:ABC-type sulfate transport system substrate-binding protein
MVILSYSSVKVAFAIFGVTLFLGQTIVLREDQITNASYDVSREFYQEVNQAFGKIWKTKTGRDVRIQGSVRSDLYSGTVDLVHRRTS